MTNTKRVTFAQLESVLLKLGFEKKVVPELGVAFRLADKRSLVIVRLYEPGDRVPDYVIAGYRKQLDEQGVIPADEFEAMLQADAA